MMLPRLLRVGTLAAFIGAAPTLAVGQETGATRTVAADTVRLSLERAFEIGRRANPEVRQAGYQRGAAGSGLWSAYGTLLPGVNLQGQAQRTEEGSFAFFGSEFRSPQTYSTIYQWNFTHSLLDSGRDLFRIQGAEAEVDEAIAGFDLTWWQARGDIARQYLTARRQEALARQAEREVDRRAEHLELAEARYEVGAVTRSDILQAQLQVNQGEVAHLEALQGVREAVLALRRLLGGELPPGPVRLTTDFEVFQPPFDPDRLVEQALASHPGLMQIEARTEADQARLWIARSTWLPGLQFQYSLSRSVVDTAGFTFSDFDSRNFYSVALNWDLFDRFARHNQISQANAAVLSDRAEMERQRLTIEETVLSAWDRLMTAWQTYEANALSVALAEEDLRLGEARYRTGAGSFVDLLDARVRATQAQTDLIASKYDFYLALVQLEQGTGFALLPEDLE